MHQPPPNIKHRDTHHETQLEAAKSFMRARLYRPARDALNAYELMQDPAFRADPRLTDPFDRFLVSSWMLVWLLYNQYALKPHRGRPYQTKLNVFSKNSTQHFGFSLEAGKKRARKLENLLGPAYSKLSTVCETWAPLFQVLNRCNDHIVPHEKTIQPGSRCYCPSDCITGYYHYRISKKTNQFQGNFPQYWRLLRGSVKYSRQLNSKRRTPAPTQSTSTHRRPGKSITPLTHAERETNRQVRELMRLAPRIHPSAPHVQQLSRRLNSADNWRYIGNLELNVNQFEGLSHVIDIREWVIPNVRARVYVHPEFMQNVLEYHFLAAISHRWAKNDEHYRIRTPNDIRRVFGNILRSYFKCHQAEAPTAYQDAIQSQQRRLVSWSNSGYFLHYNALRKHQGKAAAKKFYAKHKTILDSIFEEKRKPSKIEKKLQEDEVKRTHQSNTQQPPQRPVYDPHIDLTHIDALAWEKRTSDPMTMGLIAAIRANVPIHEAGLVPSILTPQWVSRLHAVYQDTGITPSRDVVTLVYCDETRKMVTHRAMPLDEAIRQFKKQPDQSVIDDCALLDSEFLRPSMFHERWLKSLYRELSDPQARPQLIAEYAYGAPRDPTRADNLHRHLGRPLADIASRDVEHWALSADHEGWAGPTAEDINRIFT